MYCNNQVMVIDAIGLGISNYQITLITEVAQLKSPKQSELSEL